ncbi:hypothetical protein EV714DRAFT_278010 [Schizophyllum commune]
MSAPAELLSHDYSPSPLLCSRRTFLATKFTLDKCYSCRAANSLDYSGHCRVTKEAEDMNPVQPVPRGSTSRCRMNLHSESLRCDAAGALAPPTYTESLALHSYPPPSSHSPSTALNRFRRRRTCNAQGLVGLDVLIARCHRTCQPPRRALDVVVVPAGPWRVGGDESRARSGAERRCARLFACASEREILANRRQMRRGPRPTLSLIAATVERGMGAARSAAEGADTEPFSAPLQRPKKCEIDVNCAEVRAGDEYTYRRPPSEDPSPSPPPSALDCATLLVLTFSPLFELAAPPATPSILVSTSLNISQPLGADITHSPFEGASLRGVIARALPFDTLPLTTWALSI